MALSKDCIYYKKIAEHDGYYYYLYFIAGDTSDLTTPFNFKELPNFLVEKDSVVIKSAYDSDMPVGLPLMNELQLTLDLAELNDIGGDDWSSLRSWIMNKKSTSTRSVNSRNFYIPNQWRVVFNTSDDGTGWARQLFIGVQETTSVIKIDSDGVYKLSCTGLIETAMKDTLISDVSLSTVTNYKEAIVNLWYKINPLGSEITGLEKLVNKDQYYYEDIVNLITLFNTPLNNLVAAYQRHSSTTTIDNPLTNWIFYKQDITSSNNNKSTQLLISELELIPKVDVYIYSDAAFDTVGGLMIDANSDTSWNTEFENLWALFKRLYECLLCKGFISNTDSAGGNFNGQDIENYKVFENTWGTVLSIDNTDNIIIDSDLLDNEDVLFQQSICHVPNVTSIDQNEFAYKNDNTTQDNPSFEVELKLHNQIVNPKQDNIDQSAFWNLFSFNNLKPLEYAIIQGIYYINGDSLIKVSDYCEVDVGFASNVTSESISGDADFPVLYQSNYNDLQVRIAERMAKSGMGYTIAKAGNMLFCNDNQFFVKLTLPLNLAQPEYLGRIYTIDIESLLPYSLTSNFDNSANNCILTNIESNIQENESKCTFFLRGDRV